MVCVNVVMKMEEMMNNLIKEHPFYISLIVAAIAVVLMIWDFRKDFHHYKKH